MIITLLLLPLIMGELLKFKGEVPVTVETLDWLKLTYARIFVDTEYMIENNLLQNDCSDVLFRNSTNHTIPHWVESGCGDNDTVIWLHIDSVSTLPPMVMSLTMNFGNIFHKEDPEYENSKFLEDVFFYSFSNEECSSLNDELSNRYIRISTSTSGEFGGEIYHQHQIQYSQHSTNPIFIEECSTGGSIVGARNPHFHEALGETSQEENEFPHYSLFFCSSTSLDLTSQSVVPMNMSDPPSGWREVEETYSKFLKVTSSSGNIGMSDVGYNHSHQIDSVYSNRSTVFVSSVLEGDDAAISAYDHSHIIESTTSGLQNITIPHLRVPFFVPNSEDVHEVLNNIFIFYTSSTINDMHKSIPGIRFIEESSFDGKFLLGHDTFDGEYNRESSSSTIHTHIVSSSVDSTDVVYTFDEESPTCETSSAIETFDESHVHEFEIEVESTSHLPPYFSVFMGEKYEPEYLSDINAVVHMDELTDNSWSCYGIPFENEKVCSGRGSCVGQDRCVCPDYVLGADCAESIGNGEYTSDYRKILIDYKVNVQSLKVHVPHTLEPFRCSEIIDNIEEVGEDSVCKFEMKNSLKTTSRLIIEGIDSQNVDYVYIYPITKHSETIESEITKYSQPPTIEVYSYAIPSGVGVPCLVCVCLVFCCSGIVCCCVTWRLTIRLCKLRRYRSISKAELGEMLLAKEMEEREGNVAKLRINTRLFEIEYDEIKVVDTIGEGGSNSTVFKGKWNGQTVAFKCFNTSSVCKDQTIFSEFEREVEILSSVSHPAVLDFYGATLKPPRVGIVMEYCKYGDLTDFFTKEGQLFPFIERLRILKEVSSAMSYLHSNNIIHRDLKAENVLLNKAFESKVMDFGLSRLVEEMNSELTVRIGTSVYMAPEVVKGSSYDEKCDVFSFGILIFCVTTNDFQPYSGEEDEFNIEMRVANNPNFRPKVTPELFKEEFCENQWLVDCMRSCWEDQPEIRPSFDEIEKTLTERKRDHVRKFEEKKKKKKKKDDDDEDNNSEEEEDMVTMTQEELWGLEEQMREMREKLEELHELKMKNEGLKTKVEKFREIRRKEKEAEEERKRKMKKKKKHNNNNNNNLMKMKMKKNKSELSNLIGATNPVSSSLRFQLSRRSPNLAREEPQKVGRSVKSVEYRLKRRKKEEEVIEEEEEEEDVNFDEVMSEERKNYWKQILSSAKDSGGSGYKKKKNRRMAVGQNRRIVFASSGKNRRLSNWRERAKKKNEEKERLSIIDAAEQENKEEEEEEKKKVKKKVRFQLDEDDEEEEASSSGEDDEEEESSCDEEDSSTSSYNSSGSGDGSSEEDD